MELDQKRIGKRFRNVRKIAGLTQEAFGEALDLSKNHISDIERGCSLPTVKVLISVYSQFGHTPDEILLGAVTQAISRTNVRKTLILKFRYCVYPESVFTYVIQTQRQTSKARSAVLEHMRL